MKTKNTLFLILGAALTLVSNISNAQKKIDIYGEIINMPDIKRVYFTEDISAKEIRDSAIVKNGKFHFEKLPEYSFPVLNLVHVGVQQKDGSIKRRLLSDIFLEPGRTEVKIHGMGFREGMDITGSQVNMDYSTFLEKRAEYHTDRQQKMSDPNYIRLKGPEAMAEYKEGLRKVAADFVVSHPQSFISLFLLDKDLSSMSTPEQLQELYALISPALRDSEKGKQVEQKISSAAQIEVGALAPDFTELDSLGNKVKLSSYKGRYVLVDFWASWCRPCRAEHPEIVKAYKAFQEKNFTILSVSLDKSRKAWLDAVKQDGLVWDQVSSLNPQNAESALKFGVTSIPRNFLIDPTGKIIAMDMRGHELQVKLAELVK